MNTNGQTDRFKDAPWFTDEAEHPIVGGAGGIGSWLTLFLNRAGFRPVVYDFDVIEEHNLGGQLFRQNDVGRHKVDAIYKIVQDFCGEETTIFNQAVDENTPTHYFMFSAFDNMKARRDLFNVWKKSHENCAVTPLFIDGRLVK